MPDPSRPLAGIRVLVTRPAHQAEPFCRRLEDAGAHVTRFPVIEIQPLDDPGASPAITGLLADASLAIFISRNAVEHGIKPLLAADRWPPQITVGAVGRSTGKALADLGHPPDLVPATGFNSEALLALPQLQRLQGSRVVIFRGEGGRETLAQALRARGATVSYAEVYRRVMPARDCAPLVAALEQGATIIFSM